MFWDWQRKVTGSTKVQNKKKMCSVYSVPLLFLNLGGEMMYILNQRLNAQRIPKDKATKGG
jgi:hypothetical protein